MTPLEEALAESEFGQDCIDGGRARNVQRVLAQAYRSLLAQNEELKAEIVQFKRVLSEITWKVEVGFGTGRSMHEALVRIDGAARQALGEVKSP